MSSILAKLYLFHSKNIWGKNYNYYHYYYHCESTQEGTTDKPVADRLASTTYTNTNSFISYSNENECWM